MDIHTIDAHTHVQFEQFGDDRDVVIGRALEGGVGIINAGADVRSSLEAVDLAQSVPYGVWATVGIHPDEAAGNISQEDCEQIKMLATKEKIVGIGECGFDFFRDKEKKTKDVQSNLFVWHIKLSHNVSKPLVIHSRSAFDETFEVLQAHRNLLLSDAGIFHFFTGGRDEAKKVLDLGFCFTFGGLVTYNRSFDDVIGFIPQDRILAETDAPFVAPALHRGERNEPLYVQEVVEALASIKGLKKEDMQKILFDNTTRLFKLDRP